MSSKLNVVHFDASYKELASHFDCGDLAINKFIKLNESLEDGFGRTYIWLSEDNRKIIGYYNISTGYIESQIDNIPMKIGGVST